MEVEVEVEVEGRGDGDGGLRRREGGRGKGEGGRGLFWEKCEMLGWGLCGVVFIGRDCFCWVQCLFRGKVG